MKTAEEFYNQAKKLYIQYWPIKKCNTCKTEIGYFFFDKDVDYDSSCNCDSANAASLKHRPSSWAAVARHYNVQTDPKVVNEYDKFWQFNSITL